MKALLALPLLILAAPAAAGQLPPVRDPVALNIGLSCQWQQQCMAKQRKAMKRALGFITKKQPASWHVAQCNRNAARTRYRVDWVGFENCVRNASIRYTPPVVQRAPPKKNRRGRVIEPVRSAPVIQAYRGERGR